jgi:hypothetical protein
MNRRAFLSLSAVSPLAGLLPAFAADPKRPPDELAADLVVIGGGVGGVACALAAARNGLRVIVTEEYDWVGGQLTSQAVPPDEYPTIETFPPTRLYGQFRARVRDFYRRIYPLTEAAAKNPALNPGNGSVSKLCHEPRVAVAVLLELLAPYLSGGRVRLLQPYVPVAADAGRDAVKAVIVRNTRTGRDLALTAPYFADATELGDVLPLAGVEFVTGAESRRDTREPHAPDRADPADHQACTACFAMDHIAGEDHTIPEPRSYRLWKHYVPKLTPPWPGNLLSWDMSNPVTLKPRAVGFDPTGPTPKGTLNLWTYRRIADRANFADGTYPGDLCLVNWPQNDYWVQPLVGGPPDQRDLAVRAAKELSLSLLYWMQTEAPRADGRRGWPGLRLRPDVAGTDDGLAMAPYVRESRRIKAAFTVTEQHVGTDARAAATGKKPGEFTAEPFPDTVGVGSYRIDLHPSTGGRNYVDVSSLPFQVPLGCLIPRRVENLLPACKNIGVTHITNGCYRLHPVEWSVGEAVGELIAFCLSKNRRPRQVRRDANLLKDFQAGLAKAGVALEWPPEVGRQPR